MSSSSIPACSTRSTPSLDKLGDPAHGGDKNDEAVRHIAAKMIAGARG